MKTVLIVIALISSGFANAKYTIIKAKVLMADNEEKTFVFVPKSSDAPSVLNFKGPAICSVSANFKSDKQDEFDTTSIVCIPKGIKDPTMYETFGWCNDGQSILKIQTQNKKTKQWERTAITVTCE